MKRFLSAPLCAALAGLLATTTTHAADWVNVLGGNWNDTTNWSTLDVPNSAGETGDIILPGIYTVVLNISPAIDSCSVTNADATFELPNNRNLTLLDAAGLTNDGLIVINSTQLNNNTGIRFDAVGAALNGAGEIILQQPSGSNSLNHARLHTGVDGDVSVSADQVIHGAGLISGPFTIPGTVTADVVDQELRVVGTIDLDTTGMLIADSGTLGLGNVIVSNGTIDSLNGGAATVVPALTTATVDGVTNNGDLGVRGNNTLEIDAGGVVNDGDITVNSGELSNNTTLRFDETAAITGTGEIILNAPDASTSLNHARVTTVVGVTGTLGAGQTIRGKGEVNGDFIHSGEINADRAGQELRVVGSLDQSGGGSVIADAGTAGLGNVDIVGGTIGGTGGIVEQSPFLTTSTLSGVTINGAVGIAGNNNINILAGGITNNGTITVNTRGLNNNTTLRIAENATIGGTGDIVLARPAGSTNLNHARLVITTDVAGVLGAGQTLRGIGFVDGTDTTTLTVDGEIIADMAGEELRCGLGNYDLSNGGVMRGDSGLLGLGNADIVGGTLEGINGGIVEQSPGLTTSTLDGVTLNGELGIGGNNNIEILTTAMLTGTLTVNSRGLNNNTTLRFEDGATLNGNGMVILNRQAGQASDHARMSVLGGVDATATIGADITVRGAGSINNGFINLGTILADEAEQLVFTGSGFSNQNLVRATGTGGIRVNSAFENDGTLEITSGSNLESSLATVTQIGGELLANGTMSNAIGNNLIDLQGGVMRGIGEALRTSNSARVEPGASPGTLTIVDDYTQTATGTLAIELGGFTPDTQHDVLVANDGMSFDGTLEVEAINGLVPAVGDRFTVFQANGFGGFFATYTTVGFPAGLTVRIDLSAGTSGDIVVVRIGDMNCDGVVSVSDIGPFVVALTDPAGYAVQFPACEIFNGDINGDGAVSVSDIGPFVALLTGG